MKSGRALCSGLIIVVCETEYIFVINAFTFTIMKTFKAAYKNA